VVIVQKLILLVAAIVATLGLTAAPAISRLDSRATAAKVRKGTDCKHPLEARDSTTASAQGDTKYLLAHVDVGAPDSIYRKVTWGMKPAFRHRVVICSAKWYEPRGGKRHLLQVVSRGPGGGSKEVEASYNYVDVLVVRGRFRR
jgi:hypothetical protein